jgi:hypothetical protein
LSYGTANGVAYLNGSKVLTSGSALSFDGSTLTATTTSGIPLVVTGTGGVGMRIVGGTGAGFGSYLSLQAQGGNAALIGTEAAITGSGTSTNLMLYGYGSNSIVFAPATTEGMRLTSTGLGIGTSSPANKLHVNGDTRISDTYSLFMGVGAEQKIFAAGTANSTYLTFNQWTGSAYTERMRLDSSGNLGLGATPSAWSSGKAVEVGNYGNAFWNNGASENHLTTNAYYNGGWKFGGTGYAQKLTTVSGQYQFNVSTASGTAGNAITFTQAMTLDADGNLAVGTTSVPGSNYRGYFLGNLSSNALTVGIRNTNSSGQSRFILGNDAGIARFTIGYTGTTSGGFGSSLGWIGTEGAEPVLFQTNGTERMRIDSSGNVGIGTSSPAGVVGTGRTLALYNTSHATLSVQAVDGANDRNATLELLSSGNGGSTADIVFGDTDTTPATPSPLRFLGRHSGTTTERARITSGGNFCLGTTSTTVNPGFAVEPSGRIYIGRSNDDAVAEFYRSGTRVGQINVTTTNTSYITSSDYRLKEAITPMTGALAKVAALKPVTYKWKLDGSDGQGFIAHELAEVCPDAVTGEKDAVDEEGNPKYQGIDTSFLVATLTAAIQEQQALIQDLTTRLAKLEAK